MNPTDLPKMPTEGVLGWVSGPNTQKPGQTRYQFATWYLSLPVSDAYTSALQMHAENLGLQIPVSQIVSFSRAEVILIDDSPQSKEMTDALRRDFREVAMHLQKAQRFIGRLT